MVDKKSLNYFLRCKYCKNFGTEEIKYANSLICFDCKKLHKKKTYGYLNFLHNFSQLLNENPLLEEIDESYNIFHDQMQSIIFSTYFLSPASTILLKGLFPILHTQYRAKFKFTNSPIYTVNFILVENSMSGEDFMKNEFFYRLLNKNIKIVRFSFFKDLVEGKTDFTKHYLIFYKRPYIYNYKIFYMLNFLIEDSEIIKKYSNLIVSLKGEINGYNKNDGKIPILIKKEETLQTFIIGKFFKF